MDLLSTFSFGVPWALSTLLFLPLLWFLLKTTPPKPQVIRFPAVRLLQELSSERILAAKTPWWVLVLRSLIAIFLILSLAQPVLQQQSSPIENDKDTLIILDDDYSVIDQWQPRQEALGQLITERTGSGKNTFLLSTSQPEQLRQLEGGKTPELSPKTWPIDRQAVWEAVTNFTNDRTDKLQIIWFSNGLNDPALPDFADRLASLGPVIYYGKRPFTPIIHDVKRSNSGFDVTVLRAQSKEKTHSVLKVMDDQANVLLQSDIVFEKDEKEITLHVNVPQELKGRSERLRLGAFNNPAAQFVLDEKWRDLNVAIIESNRKNAGLLTPSYYVEKSLSPYVNVQKATLTQLLARQNDLIFDVDYSLFDDTQTSQLEQWISGGGIFIRFASPRKRNNPDGIRDPLLPVRLMEESRNFGGTLSWDGSNRLAAFSPQSPFFNIEIAPDIRIKRQILAQSEAGLDQKTWVSLQDGTPLVSAKKIGRGWSILFHIEAVPGWSDLPLSGTFEAMMQRLLTLDTQTQTISETDKTLPPYKVFDHTGLLVTPFGKARAVPLSTINQNQPNSAHPPGLYGHKNSFKAYNLGPYLTTLDIMPDLPSTFIVHNFEADQKTALAPYFLLAALILCLLDWMANLYLKNIHRPALASLLALMICIPQAQSADTDWDKALAAANDMRLAYMETGNPKLDDTVRRGLDGLGNILRRRTAVELAPAMSFNPETDDPSLFPMIYWAIEEDPTPLSPEATERLNRFLQTGGFILFDTMGQARPQALASATKDLDIANLDPIAPNHVLTRSFYLMQKFPGRYDQGEVWVESDVDNKNDRVSSVLVGSNAWAQAWAHDDNMRPIYPVIPDGEIQREQAYRFGVNLVMYVLSGNYKGDQVHIPAILQRLGL